MGFALPIDAVLSEVVAAVRDRGTCVLVAPPGAGKTTRVPGALLDAGILAGEVVVLQPRRLAARLAATRVAAERGGELGGEVGYEVRFDRRIGPQTRLRFVTEGVLTRRLLADPELRGVGCVILDEFHERHLDGDLALALIARLRTRRPELRLVVMSATLDAEPVAGFLDPAGAPIVRSEGRTFPIAIEYSEQPDDRPLGRQVAAAVRRVMQDQASAPQAARGASAETPATAPTGGPSGSPAGVASGSPAGVASGSPAGVTSGSPAGVTGGSPAGVASGSPAGVTSGSPPGVASGSPAGVASGSPAGVASGSPAGVTSGPATGSTAGSRAGRSGSAESPGDILVFLPGAAEIRRCQDDLAEVAAIFDLAVLPLYGDLPVEDQDRAVRPASRRKVILATNVAETSVTIDGVVCVIDGGTARIARHSPWTGLPALPIEPVSRASCTQRAGRAGRTRPGRVIRLYTKHDHDTRRAFELAEIGRSDLAGAALELYGAGLAGLDALRWFEPPPPAAVTAADALLARLGAVERGAITPLGRRMLRFPLHPRLARIICEAEARGVAEPACAIAALVGARELRVERRGPRAEARVASSSDLLDDLDALYDARQHGMRGDRLRSSGLDPAAAHAADRIARQLTRIARDDRSASRGSASRDLDQALQISILTGFPDRVGKRRAPRSPEIVFAGGGSGALAPSSAVIDAELVVAVDVADTSARGQASKVQIRRASAIEPSWLLDLYLDQITERDELVWNPAKQRVERIAQLTYDGLAIDEQRDVEGARRAGPAAAAVLAREALAAGIENFVDSDALTQWRARVALAAKLAPSSGLTAPTDEALAQVIARACEGAISFDELRKLGLLPLLEAQLGEHRGLVDRLAPTHLKLPRRGRAPIHYQLDQPPWIASRIQDFFGLARAPSVGDGRVPLVLHLLAPNQRPVQVTTDLPGFWVKHYPALRKQLMRRYPKHAWPEDPAALIAGED